VQIGEATGTGIYARSLIVRSCETRRAQNCTRFGLM